MSRPEPRRSEKPVVRRLAGQLSASFFSLALFAVLLAGGGVMQFGAWKGLAQLEDLQRERSAAAALRIDAYLDDLQRKLGYLARVRGLSEMPPATQRELLRALLRHNSAYDAVAILDRAGRTAVTEAPTGPPRWLPDEMRLAWNHSFRQAEDHTGTITLGPDQRPTLIMSVPIRDASDRVDGALVARIDLAFLGFVVSQIDVGATGYAYVIDDRQRVVVQKGDSPPRFELVDVAGRPLMRALVGDAPRSYYEGLHGGHVIGAAASAETVHWRVVTELPLAEALAPLRVMIAWTALALALAGLASLWVGARFARRIGEPLGRLTQAAERITAGEVGVTVEATEENELGILAAAFNSMTRRLLGLIDTLEARVAERTRELREAYEHLQELDRLKNNFVNSVSHELRTPLTSIMGYAEFLEDEIGGPLSEQQVNFVREILRGSRRLELLLNDLLDYARIEAGTFKLNLTEADFVARAIEVVDSLRPQAAATRIQLLMDFSTESIDLTMDAQRIGQVLLNLLSNAVKFTPPEGRVTLRAKVVGDELVCEVADTGLGIAEEELPRLFQRFSQLRDGVRKGTGTGLGLSISKALVELHGGTIGVRSLIGEGSTFWFTLPLHPTPRPAAEPPLEVA